MKKLTILSIVLAFALAGHAQLLKSLQHDPAFTDSLNRIIKDYSTNYHNIQGAFVNSDEMVEVYQSLASVPGAQDAQVLRFHSDVDTTASWQAVMYKGEEYKDAAKAYKDIFRRINKMKFSTGNGLGGNFSGSLVQPSEDLRFTSSILYASSINGAYKNFIANVDLLYNMEGWEVRLSLNRKKDDREKY